MMSWPLRVLFGSSGLLIIQCTRALHGEPVDLPQVATPPVVLTPAAPSPVPETRPALALPRSGFRAWIPREVLANGDAIDGHYLEVSPMAPAEEVVAPAVHIPRAPKHVLPIPKATTKVRTLQPSPPEPHPSSAAPPSMPFPFPAQPGVSVPLLGLGGGQ